MKLFLALGMILMVVPSVFSFDCNQFIGINRENCINLSQVNENLIAGLIYTNTSRPDYAFVQNYNSKIIVSQPPENTSFQSKTIIKNAWIKILSISPEILYKGLFFVPDNIQVRSESNYSIQIPANYNNPSQSNGAVCKIDYSLASQSSSIFVFTNGVQVASGKIVQISITQNSTLKTQLTVSVSVKADQSNWQKYCCKTRYGSCVKYCYRCKFQSTSYITESLTTDDKADLKKYESTASATAEFIQKYYNTSKGIINSTNTTSFVFTTGKSTLK